MTAVILWQEGDEHPPSDVKKPTRPVCGAMLDMPETDDSLGGWVDCGLSGGHDDPELENPLPHHAFALTGELLAVWTDQ